MELVKRKIRRLLLENMLKISQLNIKYNKNIFNNVSIEFQRGNVTLIKGVSGSGKSSLLNVLGLIKKPNNECEYQFDGEKIDLYNEKETALFRLTKVGFIFQQNNLINTITVLENIMVPLRMITGNEEEVKKRAKEWTKFVGIQDLENSYPADLSGGEEQRVTIARALINNGDIILADEPTASLDQQNKEMILTLLKRLAKELNKIVIIVSHDEEVSKICDVVYEIKDCDLIKIKGVDEKIPSDKNESTKNNKTKNILGFVKIYNKKIRKEKILNKTIIIITALIAAFASLFMNFGDSFSSQQKMFVNSISDRNLLVINDTLGINTDYDYGDALAFSPGMIDKIHRIPNINKIYDFYELTSFGVSVNKEDKSSLSVLDGNGNQYKEISYENTYIASDNEFRVAPLYREEDLQYLLKYQDETISDGIFLTMPLATKLSDNPSELIGKILEIKCFVPTKLYNSTATKAQGGNSRDSLGIGEEVEIDGSICKLITIKKIISGILEDSYENIKSDNNGDLILIKQEELKKIIEENKDTQYGETFQDFQEKELQPSMLVIFAESYDDVSIIKEKVSVLSPTITVINKATDIKKINENITNTKNIMYIISFVILIIVIVMFGFISYFTNLKRKKEIGILKALGLTKNDIILLIGYNMVLNAIKTFGLSVIFSYMIALVFEGLLGIPGLLKVTLESIIITFILTVFIIIFSGIFSVWKTSRIDIIDAIRNNR